jgi:inner membrane protein
MDPLSQASLGASLSQSFADNRTKSGQSAQLAALLIGALAGMAPDLDILIRSTQDPLLFLEYHRQFTHALSFIPFGALVCAVVFYPFARRHLPFRYIYLFSFLGYATHGLLDACTSYGTQLLWPFSNMRVSWSTVSIVDPLFTVPVLLLVIFAAWKKSVVFARFAFLYAVVFLCFGLIQKERAEDFTYALAELRGHQVERIHVKPSFGNRHIWKLIYEYDGRYYVDAVRLLFDEELIEGSSIQQLDLKRDFPWLIDGSQQAIDVERYRWFSDDFLAVNPQDSNIIMDVRYSYLPNQISMMWGIELEKYYADHDMHDEHVGWVMNGSVSDDTWRRFWEMLF